MSSNFGNNLKISLFGEALGPAVGVVIDGLEPGIHVDMNAVFLELQRRKGGNPLTAPRSENDMPRVISGIVDDTTCGTPICAVIENDDALSSDYDSCIPRPGHADYTGHIKYKGFNDSRGGGHFSARATTGIVFAGALCKQTLKTKGITVGSHILAVGSIKDEPFDKQNINPGIMQCLAFERIPLLNPYVKEEIEEAVVRAKMDNTSLGGIVEGAVIGVPPGVGEPFFDSIESVFAHLLFSIPSVKGVDFGAGFELAEMQGHEANDQMFMDGDRVSFSSNLAGGINGGISNGQPIVCRAAFKPTPSIGRNQSSVNLKTKETAEIALTGRHEPCTVLRACPIVESMLAIGILDLLYSIKG